MSQPIDTVRWVPVRNTDSVPVPPFGAMEIAGPIDDQGTIPITRPTKDGQTDVLFNWIGIIPTGGVGQGHQTFPCVAAYSWDNEDGIDPADGEIWGTKTGDWLLSRERAGFRVVGDGQDGLCNVVRMTMNLVLFVRVTSVSATSGRYPATEKLYDPVAKTWADGSLCWWADANGSIPTLNEYYQPIYVGFADGKKSYLSAVSASSGGSGVYGQANDSPAVPGEGPRSTIDFKTATPAIGDNLDVSISDDPGNDRLIVTYDNLGIFARAQGAGSTYGPNRRLNVVHTPPAMGSNMSVVASRDVGNDEVVITLANLGIFGRVGAGGTSGPRERINIDAVTPAVGANLTVGLADDGANTELDFTITNLGMFVRAKSGTTYGPYPRTNFLRTTPAVGDNLDITAANDAGNTETTITIENKGGFVRAQGAGTTYGPYPRLSVHHSPPGMGSNLSVVAGEDAGNTEGKITIANLGMFIRADGGGTIGPRPRIEFISGTGITVTAADDGANDEVNVTVAANAAVINATARDWHYYRHVDTTSYYYSPWPCEFTNSHVGLGYSPASDGQIVAVPFLEGRGGTLDRIGIYIGIAASTGGSLARLGIYTNTSTTNFSPNALLLDAGTIAVTATGFITATISQALTGGSIYWLVVRFDSGAGKYPTGVYGWAAGTPSYAMWAPRGVNSGDVLGGNAYWFRAIHKTGLGALAALADPFPSSPSVKYRDVAVPIIYVRYSS